MERKNIKKISPSSFFCCPKNIFGVKKNIFWPQFIDNSHFSVFKTHVMCLECPGRRFEVPAMILISGDQGPPMAPKIRHNESKITVYTPS